MLIDKVIMIDGLGDSVCNDIAIFIYVTQEFYVRTDALDDEYDFIS